MSHPRISPHTHDHTERRRLAHEHGRDDGAEQRVARGLEHIHSKNIVHRDLKTANCFLSEDGTIKIGDLNVSKRMKNGLCATQSTVHDRQQTTSVR